MEQAQAQGETNMETNVRSWSDMLVEFEVRECKVCTSLIANDRNYGRKASKTDSDVCEVCEVATKNNKNTWNVYRTYKGIDSIVDVDGTFRNKNDKEIEVKN